MSSSPGAEMVLEHATPRSVVLWHGRGPNEDRVLSSLAGAIYADGNSVVVPDWDHGASDRGAGALRASLAGALTLDGSVPQVRVTQALDHPPPALHLVRGRHDSVITLRAAEDFADACRVGGVLVVLDVLDVLDVVASDHAGVVGTTYDAKLGFCLPSRSSAATAGLAAARRAVASVLSSS